MDLERRTSEPRAQTTPDTSPDAVFLWPFAAARFATETMRWWLDADIGPPAAQAKKVEVKTAA